MRLLAALAGGTFAYLLVGALTGHLPRALTAPRRRRQRVLSAWLHQAGVSVSPSQFLGASASAGIVTFVVLWAVSGAAPVALVPAAVVAALPGTWFARQRGQLGRERLAAWPDALRDLVAHLEAPMSLHRGLAELGRTGPRALRPTWRRYEALTAALDYRAALEAIRDDLADPVSDRVIEVLLVAHEQGAKVVVDILRQLAEATAQDLRLVEEIDTAQLEQRIEANAAAVLPFAVLVLLCASSVPYREFYGSAGGAVIIVFGAGMTLVGRAVIRRLGRLPTEERVFTGSEVR